MIALICALINIFIMYINYNRNQNVFHPVFLLNSMWLIVHILNFILGWNSNEVEYFILAIPSCMFSIGFRFMENHSFCFGKSNSGITRLETVEYYGLKRSASNLLFLATIILFFAYGYYFYTRMGGIGGLNSWYQYRMIAWTDNPENNVFFKYGAVFVFLMPSLFLISAQKTKHIFDWVKFAVVLAISIAWSFFRTSRTSTFTVVILLVMTQIVLRNGKNTKDVISIKKEKIKNRRLFLFAVVFILLVFLSVALQKNPDEYGSVSRIEFYVRNISNYTNLSSAAFVEWYKNGFEYTNGENSFRFIYAVLNALGVGTKSRIGENFGGLFITYKGMSTNALTVARAYVEDFGIVFMATMLNIFGLIHGAIYKRVVVYRGLYQMRFALINAMLCIPMFYQILTNQYLNVLSGWIQYVIWICIFTQPICWKKVYLHDE